jgi:hypothetical protein
MASKLVLRQYIPLPPHPQGDFDHGDVSLESGRVFVANTATPLRLLAFLPRRGVRRERGALTHRFSCFSI